jgi:NitT/TauT family transport system substrate-binding protein
LTPALLLRLLAFTAVVFLAGCQSSAPPAGKDGRIPIRLQADWYPQPEHGGFYTALAKGYYEAQGLDITILPVGQYTSSFQVVASGRAEFGLGSSDQVLEAVSNGLPVVAVGAVMQHDPQAVMVHENSPVKTFADLEGRTVAAQPGATWFKFLVSKYGLKNVRETPATHSIANFLADPNYIQQIFITSEPFFVKQAGATYRTLLISTAGYDPYRVFFADRRFAEKQPEAVRKFVHASLQGWQEYLRDPAPAHALILKANPAQKPDQLGFTFGALRDGNFITGDDATGAGIGKMSPERWATLNDQLTTLGIVRHKIDPATAYTTQFLP